MQVHGLIALLARLRLHEARAATLDLDLAACLLLDVLDIVTTTANNLCTQVEAANRLETDRDLLFRPFALD